MQNNNIICHDQRYSNIPIIDVKQLIVKYADIEQLSDKLNREFPLIC